MRPNPPKKLVVIGLLGTTLDQGKGPNRWQRWRPTVALCQHEDLLVDRLELLVPQRCEALAQIVSSDIANVSPETLVSAHTFDLEDPWALEEVYERLYDFAAHYPFDTEAEDYLVHITTGTHIAQICLFLLTESRHIPARLVQTSPPTRAFPSPAGGCVIIDLDLSKYDRIASRFRKEHHDALASLKSGIRTQNKAFNQLVERIERVATRSKDPVLLLGPTGAGKSQLAKRIYELKRARRQIEGEFVEVNCATIRGDAAMSTLFGHLRGAFTGAANERSGMLKKAHGGLLFLDEVGELGLDEQAMLLRAIEEKTYYPMGSDREVRSEFQLVAGTNRDLALAVAQGRFREDLLARVNLWTFRLPSLRERPEDFAPNLDYELEQCARVLGSRVRFSREAKERFLAFAVSEEAKWSGNFRDFNAAVRRMATLCEGGRIKQTDVNEEIGRLREAWRSVSEAELPQGAASAADLVSTVLGPERAELLDAFDRVQLAEVLRVCQESKTLSDAGRRLFEVSRSHKRAPNDADRLRKYLARFGIEWSRLRPRG
ncbi:MAG TPA: RNA repair transcriptional activator RtcR [Polyangiaceae bacterium]|nr:RNA repair transcriptional activator RtcR [Polyangiaceae bacterium]